MAELSELSESCTRWADQWWDPEVALPWAPPGHEGTEGGKRLHMLPQAARYALALLERQADGDVERAMACLGALCALQYDEPGTDIHGTFPIFAETPHPPASPAMWDDYDPNWRQFLGTIFVLIVTRHAEHVPRPLRDRLLRAVRLAVEGEPPRRIPPSYANIALMHAWLQHEGGLLLDEPTWCSAGEAFAEKIVERFDRFGCFDEYNSPTYYGIDLEALALWRSWSASPLLARWGARLEAELWSDLADWYHPGLRNLCGPYTRAYGLDMTTHLGSLGLWFADAFGMEGAPLPPMTPETPHGHDWFHGPYVALLGARPQLVDENLTAPRDDWFSAEREIDRAPERTVSHAIGPDVMFGAERGSADFSWWDQFKSATGHWLRADGLTGAFEVRAPGPSDARTEFRSLFVRWSADAGDGNAQMTVQRPNGGVRVDRRELHLGDDRTFHLDGRFRVASIGAPVQHTHGAQVTIVFAPEEGRSVASLSIDAV